MKYLLFFTVLFNYTSLIFDYTGILSYRESLAEKTSFAQIPLAEQLYERLELKTNMPNAVNRFIDRKALNRPDVPSTKWEEIKNNIDYSYFKQEAISAINNYYSNAEIQALLNEYVDKPYVPITNIELRNELVNIAMDFNSTSLMPSINSMLTSAGYDPI